MKNAPPTRPPSPCADAPPVPSAIADYLALTKPRLNVLVVAGSAAGYYLGATRAIDLAAMAEAVAGTALVAGGAAALNQVYERDTDALMRRTRMRPLPDGRVAPADARVFGRRSLPPDSALLAARTNWLSTLLALATLVIYLAIYTPMKRRTPLVDAGRRRAGRLPALIGWTASHGSIDRGGAALFAIVCSAGRLPHFMAIAWLYRDDYALAGFPMLPVIDPEGRRAGKQAVYWAILLVLASLGPDVQRTCRQRLSRRRARARRRHPAGWRFDLRPCAARPRRARCSRLDHLPAAVLDRDDRQPSVTVHDLPAVNATLNGLSGVLLAIGYVLIRMRRIELHRKVMISAFVTSSLVPGLLCRLPRAGRIGAVRPSGVRAAVVFHDSDHPRHAGRDGGPARDHHADARPEGAIRPASTHRPLDLPDLDVRVGDRRARLRAAVPADLADLNWVIGGLGNWMIDWQSINQVPDCPILQFSNQ